MIRSPALRRLIDGALELIYPSCANCMGCGSPLGADDGHLCLECIELLTPASRLSNLRCPRCGRPTRGGRCGACRDWPPDSIDMARFAYPYRRPMDQMIRRLKYGGVRSLAPEMGAAIADMLVCESFPDVDLMVPVPMHPRRLRERGFNHAALIAREAADRLGIECGDALVRVRHTRQQARLDRAQREQNVANAFAADGRVAGLRVLIIDDVLTSGATATNCALALKASGAVRAYVATLAAATD